ncbi:MAG: hypothetical protein ACOCP7_01840 [Desulfohalobiaceae bacterium]
MAELLVGHIRNEALPELLDALAQPEPALLLAFAPDRFWLEPWQNQAKDMARTEQGRVFGPHGEVKWRMVNQGFQLVYLGESGPRDWLADASSELSELHPAWRDILLWGQRTDLEPEWIEQQVPHRFNYPLSSQEHKRGRVKIRLEEWRNKSELPCFVRYHSLQEAEGE